MSSMGVEKMAGNLVERIALEYARESSTEEVPLMAGIVLSIDTMVWYV